MMKAMVHAADITDREGAKWLLWSVQRGRFPRLKKIWVDEGYSGELVDWVKETFAWILEVVRKPRKKWWLPTDKEIPEEWIVRGFQVLPRRWVVERTLAWLGKNRRLSKDYEYLTQSNEAFIYTAMVRVMVKRLALKGGL